MLNYKCSRYICICGIKSDYKKTADNLTELDSLECDFMVVVAIFVCVTSIVKRCWIYKSAMLVNTISFV